MIGKAINADGNVIYPTKTGLHAYCPGCREEVISVVPQCDIVNHWRHTTGEDCDTWYSPHDSMCPWHRSWQNLVCPEFTEVFIGEHRADIQGNNGIVIEIQHSTMLSIDEVRAREEYYGNMIWVLDASTFLKGRKYDCHVASGSADLLYHISGRLKKLRQFKKPLYVHLDCGAITRIESIDDKTINMKFVLWKTFIDRYLSEVLNTSYPGDRPQSPGICPVIDGAGTYVYPDCLYQMYFKRMRDMENMRQTEISKNIYGSAGMGFNLSLPLAATADGIWKYNKHRISELQYENVMDLRQLDPKVQHENEVKKILYRLKMESVECDEALISLEWLEARLNAIIVYQREYPSGIWDYSINNQASGDTGTTLSQKEEYDFGFTNCPDPVLQEETMGLEIIFRIYNSMKTGCTAFTTTIDTECLKNRLNNSRKDDQSVFTNDSLLKYLFEMERMGTITKEQRRNDFIGMYYEWSPRPR